MTALACDCVCGQQERSRVASTVDVAVQFHHHPGGMASCLVPRLTSGSGNLTNHHYAPLQALKISLEIIIIDDDCDDDDDNDDGDND